MSDFSQTVPELVAWARKNDFSISLPTERLAFILAIATLNSERLDGEMSEGELIDAFRHVSKAFEQTHETEAIRANNAINDLVKQRQQPLLVKIRQRRVGDIKAPGLLFVGYP